MNTSFAIAGVLAIAVGLVHSVLGERLVFRRMRAQGLIPTNGGEVLREPHVRIIWASWHIVTVLGCCLGVVLFWLAQPANAHLAGSWVVKAIAIAMLVSAALVLVGTKAKHPGWAGLLAAAVFIFTGMGR